MNHDFAMFVSVFSRKFSKRAGFVSVGFECGHAVYGFQVLA